MRFPGSASGGVPSSLQAVQHIKPEAPATQFRELSAPGEKGFISDILQRAPLFWGQGDASSCKVCYMLDGLSRTFFSVRHCFDGSRGISSLRYSCDVRVVCLGHTLCSRIRSSIVKPEASGTRFRKPLAPEGDTAVPHVTFTIFEPCGRGRVLSGRIQFSELKPESKPYD